MPGWAAATEGAGWWNPQPSIMKYKQQTTFYELGTAYIAHDIMQTSKTQSFCANIFVENDISSIFIIFLKIFVYFAGCFLCKTPWFLNFMAFYLICVSRKHDLIKSAACRYKNVRRVICLPLEGKCILPQIVHTFRPTSCQVFAKCL